MAIKSEIAVISCGPYATILSGSLESLGISSFCPGGDLQLFFGIAGKRWRKWLETQSSYLSNKDCWIDQIPYDHIPPQYRTIEGGCYWT